MKTLTDAELAAVLEREPQWGLEDGRLVRTWKFEDFLAAMRFVQRVAQAAEDAGHHPDIDIRYNLVKLGLVTHDAGGITALDAEMAATLSRIP